MPDGENRFSSTAMSLLTSGLDATHDIETRRKVMLLNVISLTGVFFMVPLGTVAFFQGNWHLALADYLTALILLLNQLYLQRTRNTVRAGAFGITIAGFLYAYLLATGGVNGTAHLWYYTFPLFASFLLGSKRGAVATGLLLAFAIIFFAADIESPHLANYTKDFILRFLPSFIVVFIYSYAFEYFREKAQKELTLKNSVLHRTVSELKTTETRLRRTQDSLEKRVLERTAELSQMNIDLTHEIEVRERTERERRHLETQLVHSQKMEAIGTLAGGVAHDLNNLLSAMVGFPDLILMDLPEESPLRAPVSTIKQTGKKAAAIVEDLLTLARRGVVTSEITNLNQVMGSYLDSPEFSRLSELHRGVGFNISQAPELPNIMGSPVHLSKAIMNLVNNAAEAIPHAGSITISTERRYIDQPIRGNDIVQEGDYAVLTVSDTGTGISEGDLERIFEPFFTKKTMGRSGTGLGMAVVWGTVKDHDGYIDIDSSIGQGSTFTLYFPITRQEATEGPRVPSMDEFMGNGETILVVDDVSEQREIACMMLTTLGYSVKSVASGEEAVEHMATHPVDLMILDMIMDPGIDGLETYRQILDLRPEQKAIIASGYSATERVKEVQELGAGAYLRKPYTVDQIGVIVKAELAN